MRRLVLCAVLQLVPAAVSHADVFTNVAEASGYRLVYTLNIPNAANYSAAAVPYAIDQHQAIAVPIDRIAYYLELITPSGQLQYVYASMDAFTQDLRQIGILGGQVTGGSIEFWRSNYATDNVAGVPNAAGGTYDFGDNAGGPAGAGTYGSFQVHNHDTRQTLIAYNRWNDGVTASDLGLGNNTVATGDGRVNPDWTFRANAGEYSVRTLQVLVREGVPTQTAVLPLGDSITFGAGGVAGYRDRLLTRLHATGRSYEFVGSSGGNPSAALTAASQVNHEGHSGYRIDQIAGNLSARDGSGGNNGGYWFNPGARPDAILLHIGTNDIWQRYNPGARGKSGEQTFMANLKNRLDALVDQITSARPDAHLLLAGIIPMNVNSGKRSLNDDVKAYNDYIKFTRVPKYQNLGRQVVFVDQYQNFINANGTIKAALLPDGVHPNQAGYDLMADSWFSAIAALP